MRWHRLRLRIRRLLQRELAWPRAALLAPMLVAGCMGGMSPRGKLDDAVQEMNMAARFGRNDIATGRVQPAARDAFVQRHRFWGGEVRIVDVEYGGIEKASESEAIILVAFGWYRPTEGVLRTTTVRQTWRNDKGTGPWFLVDEQRAAGDVGLLGEATKVLAPPKKTVQFETTVIRE